MKFKGGTIAIAIMIAGLCTFGVNVAESKDKPKNKKSSTVKSDRVESAAYSEIFKDKKVKSATGLITIHKVDDKIYMEIPASLMQKPLLMGVTVDRISDVNESSSGVQPSTPVPVIFRRTDSLVMLCKIDRRTIVDEKSDNIYKAISQSNIPAVLESFPIKAFSLDSSAVIEATSLFVSNDKALVPLDPTAFNSMEGYVSRTATFVSGNSTVVDVSGFDDNVSVTSCLSYKVSLYLFGVFTIVKDKPLTAYVKRTFVRLPKSEMSPRIADSRIGTLNSSYIEYSEQKQKITPVWYVNRWNIEPVDSAAWKRGDTVNVKQPIIFYVDDNFPKQWRVYIANSISKWNRAFAGIGFHRPIQTISFSDAGTDFDPSNIKFSTIRYVPTMSDKITDNSWCDPRSGEIISANIYIGCNVPVRIQQKLFMQTSAFLPEARTLKLPESLLEECVVSQLMRNIGHCLGLADNLAASNAYPIDSLRSLSFTSKYGISASVMDDLDYNYVLRETDDIKTSMICQGEIGEYDKFALEWIYSRQDDAKLLQDLISQQRNNKALRFAKRQSTKAFYDYTAMSGDLSDNLLQATSCGIDNLATALNGADEWLANEDRDLSYRQTLYEQVFYQLFDYLRYGFVSIGAIRMDEKQEGDPNPTFESLPREQQYDALMWVMAQMNNLDWLDNAPVKSNVGLMGSVSDFSRRFFSRFVFSQIDAMWLSELKSEHPYTQVEALNDISQIVWKDALLGKEPTELHKIMQRAQVDYLIGWSNLYSAKKSGSNGATLGFALVDYPELNAVGKKLLRESVSDNLFDLSVNAMTPLTSIRYSSQPDRDHVWYGKLLEVREMAQKAKMIAPNSVFREHYSYIIFNIDKALKNK